MRIQARWVELLLWAQHILLTISERLQQIIDDAVTILEEMEGSAAG